MRAHLPVSIAIFDWSGNVFRLARFGIVRYVCVSLFSREIGTFHRGGAIAIFIDTI